MCGYRLNGRAALLVTIVVSLLVTTAANGTPVAFDEERSYIEGIAREAGTASKRSQAISQLIEIVERPHENDAELHLRQFAAEELGELEASEAKQMLKDLALSLEWKDPYVYLKQSATLAYWQIVVAEQDGQQTQEDLLVSLLSNSAPEPRADAVWVWAVDELANRGVARAVPAIAECIERRIGASSRRAEYEIWLCRTKVDLLQSSATRHSALAKALATRDPGQYQKLKSWAIEELGELDTSRSRMTLVNFALGLQETYYDAEGRMIEVDKAADPLQGQAGDLYNCAIGILRDAGITGEELKAVGLDPRKFFFSP